MNPDYKNIYNSIQSINFMELSSGTGNIYKVVSVLGLRSRQVSTALKEELNQKLQEFTPATDSLEETYENREQIEIARAYESLPKPALIAIHEFFDNKIYFKDPGDPLDPQEPYE